jgi:hypothetical protein
MTKKLFFYLLLAVLITAPTVSLASVDTRYEAGVLKLLIKSNDLVPRINSYLNKNASGRITYSHTRKASIRNFRTSFKDGYISISFDYDAKRREAMSRPAWLGSGVVMGPMTKDSGWVEVDVEAHVSEGYVLMYVDFHQIKWEKRTWFTDALSGELYDSVIADRILKGVYSGISRTIGRKSFDANALIMIYGIPEVARSSGQTDSQAAERLTESLYRQEPAVFVDSSGINIHLRLVK